MTVAELGERAVLARIQARLSTAGRQTASLVIGIGDDAAVVAPTRNAQTVLTTDAQVEGVHFDRRFSAPGDVGFRALAVNLSDLAAMGAVPRWALLSLAMPNDLPVADVEELVGELGAQATRHGMLVVGGNLTRSPGPLVVDVTVVGEVRPRRVLTRNGGRAGDELWVSGTLGAAAAGLEILASRLSDAPAGRKATKPSEEIATSTEGRDGSPDDRSQRSCIARYLRPEPRLRLGLAMAQARAAHAAMDLSDGLADAARQVAEASECGVEIDASALPIDAAARQWWEAAGKNAVSLATAGGDDYELLFAVPRTWGGRLRHARSRVAEPPLTRIGVLTKDRGHYVLLRNGAREPLDVGFKHW